MADNEIDNEADKETGNGDAGNGATAAAGPSGGDQAQGTAPVGLRVLGQYLKDLSFENPGAPGSLRGSSDEQPSLDVNVNVNAKPLGPDQFEVELKLDATAKRGDTPLFVAEVAYAGVFQLSNVPQEQVQPVILIECPRLLFPFARQVVADATRQGGFPPLMIDPIDFVRLYNQRVAELKTRQMAAATAADRTGCRFSCRSMRHPSASATWRAGRSSR